MSILHNNPLTSLLDGLRKKIHQWEGKGRQRTKIRVGSQDWNRVSGRKWSKVRMAEPVTAGSGELAAAGRASWGAGRAAMNILHSRSGEEAMGKTFQTVYFKYVKIWLRLNRSIAKNEPSTDLQGITALPSHLLEVQRSPRWDCITYRQL